MTLDTYRNLMVGDEIHLTQKYRNGLIENMFEMNNVGGNIRKCDGYVVWSALDATALYDKIEIIQLITNVGDGNPGMKVLITYPNFKSHTTILRYKSVYKKRRIIDGC